MKPQHPLIMATKYRAQSPSRPSPGSILIAWPSSGGLAFLSGHPIKGARAGEQPIRITATSETLSLERALQTNPVIFTFDELAGRAVHQSVNPQSRIILLTDRSWSMKTASRLQESLHTAITHFGLTFDANDPMGACEAIADILRVSQPTLSDLLRLAASFEWHRISFSLSDSRCPPSNYQRGPSGRYFRTIPKARLIPELHRIEHVANDLLIEAAGSSKGRFHAVH